MKDNIIQKLKELLEEGKQFTYNNFSSKDVMGYPDAYTPDYITWKIKMCTLFEKHFGKDSPVFQIYQKGDRVSVLGNGPGHFKEAHNYLIGALKSAIELEFDDFTLTENKKNTEKNKKVFVVHGHDEQLKQEVEIFLNEMGLEPIVLHRQPDKGQTIIEKFESNSDVGYAIVLLTPDDTSYFSTEESKKQKNFRARQNVIFELGFFVGKLGRERVCCIYKETVELPADISGVIYKKVSTSLEEVKYAIIKDLKAVGYLGL